MPQEQDARGGRGGNQRTVSPSRNGPRGGKMLSIVSQRRELISGLLVLLIGVAATFESLQYPLGTLANIGPGMFPAGIGVLLALVGAAITVSGFRIRNEHDEAAIDWRGWGCI